MRLQILWVPLVLLSLSTSGWAAETEIQPGVQYPGGSRVKSSSLGVSFVIPEAWFGGILANNNTFTLVSNTQPGMVTAVSEYVRNIQTAARMLSEPLPLDENNHLFPSEAPKVEGNELRQAFQGQVEGKAAVGVARGLVHDTGVGIVFVGIGLAAQADLYRGLIDELAKSVEFTTPVSVAAPPGGWDNYLRGTQLYLVRSSQGFHQERRVDLCPDDRFVLTGNSGSFGDGASWADQESSAGLWHILITRLASNPKN